MFLNKPQSSGNQNRVRAPSVSNVVAVCTGKISIRHGYKFVDLIITYSYSI